MCHAIWQCMSQAPGLFAGKANTNQPFAGNVAVSLRGGLAKFREEVMVDESKKEEAWWPRTKKSWPWRWMGSAMGC
jgi:hypothetical protein